MNFNPTLNSQNIQSVVPTIQSVENIEVDVNPSIITPNLLQYNQIGMNVKFDPQMGFEKTPIDTQKLQVDMDLDYEDGVAASDVHTPRGIPDTAFEVHQTAFSKFPKSPIKTMNTEEDKKKTIEVSVNLNANTIPSGNIGKIYF